MRKVGVVINLFEIYDWSSGPAFFGDSEKAEVEALVLFGWLYGPFLSMSVTAS